MPLPPAPSKKAARLAAEHFKTEAPAAPLAVSPASVHGETSAATDPSLAPVVLALEATPLPELIVPSPTPTEKTPVQSLDEALDKALDETPKPRRRKKAATATTKATTAAATDLPTSPTMAIASQTAAPTLTATHGPTKLFVLDTNVLLHDPTSLFRFEEHDVYLPMIVLEELDGHKKGMTEVARNGRQVSRTLDALAAGLAKGDMSHGLPLSSLGNKEAGGRLYFQTAPLAYQLPSSLPQGKADNQILGVVQALQEQHPGRVVAMVSKDINMRIKARALGLDAQDYENDKTLNDGELLYSGALALPTDFWTSQRKKIESWQQGAYTFYRVSGAVVNLFHINQFVYFEAAGEPSLHARVVEIREQTAVLRTLRDFGHLKNGVWGVTSRNREQNFALNLLMDPEVDFVTLTGTAGTGKTLLTLAAGLTQVLDERRYTEIIMTRATVSVGEDIGFLPGNEEEKMGPWMGALDDNLEFLAKGDGGNAGEWGRAATNELIRTRIKVKSMNFMRGRTFMNKFVIIDEAQNLTPKQMKTLITRAGPGTKIVCMGNLAQIDTPYLTEGSSGLTYAVDRFRGWPHGGHITLARGERSRLADYASDVL